MLLLLTPAFALDCFADDPAFAICETTKQMIEEANGSFGGMAIAAEGVPKRRTEFTVLDFNYRMMAKLESRGCLADLSTVESRVAGAYDGTSVVGLRDGAHDITGSFNPVDRSFSLSDPSPGYAFLISRYSSQRTLTAEPNTGGGAFFVGQWLRVQGKRGVFMGFEGECTGVVPAAVALKGTPYGIGGWTHVAVTHSSKQARVNVWLDDTTIVTNEVVDGFYVKMDGSEAPIPEGAVVALTPGGVATFSPGDHEEAFTLIVDEEAVVVNEGILPNLTLVVSPTGTYGGSPDGVGLLYTHEDPGSGAATVVIYADISITYTTADSQ